MFSLPGEVTPEVLAKFPDVLAVTKAEEDVGGHRRRHLRRRADDALAAYNDMRAVEGEKLAATWRAASPPSKRWWAGGGALPQTVAAYRQRLEAKMVEVLQSTTIDESRILTEAAIFADKIAVDEETVRLQPSSPSSGLCWPAMSRWAASWTSSFRRSTASATPSGLSVAT